MKTVKAGRFPGLIRDLVVEDGTTLGAFLEKHNLQATPPREVRVNGELRDDNYELNDGDLILHLAPIVGEATIKRDGIWRVHANDADDVFPSDWHAHGVDAREVLDLHTGRVFNPTSKQQIRKLSKSDLNYIQDQLGGPRKQPLQRPEWRRPDR